MSVTLFNPEEFVAALFQIRSADKRRTLIANAAGVRNQTLVEALSTKIRDLLPSDPDLARSLSETNLYLASLLDTPLAWAFANRSRGHVFCTMRKSHEAEPYFDQAVQLFEQAGLAGEVGRTLVGQIDNLMYLSRYSEALEAAERARQALEKANESYISRY